MYEDWIFSPRKNVGLLHWCLCKEPERRCRLWWRNGKYLTGLPGVEWLRYPWNQGRACSNDQPSISDPLSSRFDSCILLCLWVLQVCLFSPLIQGLFSGYSCVVSPVWSMIKVAVFQVFSKFVDWWFRFSNIGTFLTDPLHPTIPTEFHWLVFLSFLPLPSPPPPVVHTCLFVCRWMFRIAWIFVQ